MIIQCPECKKDISDKAHTCIHCGYPLKYRNQKRVTKKFKRNPNGFGQIRKLSGNRRNPYAAYPPVNAYKDNGSPIQRSAIGYYPTYQDAQLALIKYNENPTTITKNHNDYTFKQVYDMYYNSTFDNPNVPTSESNKKIHDQMILCVKELWDIPIKSITTRHMQEILDSGTITSSKIGKTITVCRHIYAYALQNDIVDKDYAVHLKDNSMHEIVSGLSFTEEEINILKSHSDDNDVRYILCLIYTGLRKGETIGIEYNAEGKYLKGGLKTKAGKNRIIPVHPYIHEWIENGIFNRFSSAGSIGNMFNRCAQKYGIYYASNGQKHRPHDCRHTFSWLCDKYGIDSTAKHKIMGHATGDVEIDVYGHRTLEELTNEICKIP